MAAHNACRYGARRLAYFVCVPSGAALDILLDEVRHLSGDATFGCVAGQAISSIIENTASATKVPASNQTAKQPYKTFNGEINGEDGVDGATASASLDDETGVRTAACLPYVDDRPAAVIRPLLATALVGS